MVGKPDNDEPDLAEETDDPQRALTPVQERAIIALLNEQTISRAAGVAEVGQRTLYRWLRQPEFSRAYREARREAFGQAIALTQRYAPVAVNTLVQVMMDDSAPSSSKVAAATTLLRFGREPPLGPSSALTVTRSKNPAPSSYRNSHNYQNLS